MQHSGALSNFGEPGYRSASATCKQQFCSHLQNIVLRGQLLVLKHWYAAHTAMASFQPSSSQPSAPLGILLGRSCLCVTTRHVLLTESQREVLEAAFSFDFLHVTLLQTQEPRGIARFPQPEKGSFLCSWGAVLTIVEKVCSTPLSKGRALGNSQISGRYRSWKQGCYAKHTAFHLPVFAQGMKKQTNKNPKS